MPFINEHITPEDREIYGLDELDKLYQRLFLPMSHGSIWTIDRQRNSYLRVVKLGREPEGEGNINYFSFYYAQEVYVIKFSIEAKGVYKGHLDKSYKLLKILMPAHGLCDEGLNVLKEALNEFKDLGLLSRCTSFKAEFEF